MKGSNKEFSKFLNSEYNDDYLEPLEDKNQKNIEKLVKTVAQQQRKDQTVTPKDVSGDEKKTSIQKTHLVKDMVVELASQLGEDVQNCINHLKSIETVHSVPILETYKDLYSKFETLPVLFLSVTPDSIIYLWQINKMCPYKKERDMALDSSSLALKTCPHLSVMLLAKIKSDNYGELIDANLLGDSQLYVKTRGADNEITIRFYDIETFRNTARINPFNQEVLANKYSRKIVIKGYKNEEDQTLNNMDVSFWKQTTASKEELLETRTINEIPTVFNNMFDYDFNVIHRLNSCVTVLLNRYPAIVIAWEDDQLDIVCNKELVAGSVKRMNTGLIFYDQEGSFYDVVSKTFPTIKMEKIMTQSLPKGYDSRINEWKNHEAKCKNIMNFLMVPYLRRDINDALFVYNVPLSLINLYLVNKNNQKNDDQDEEKKEENILEKIDKKRAELKNTHNQQNSMQEKNELLKEIRADIASKLKEVQEFDKEYQEEQKKWKPKEMKAPEGVSKESVELYSEIKAEKKRLAKDREKQKADRKKDRLEKNEY